MKSMGSMTSASLSTTRQARSWAASTWQMYSRCAAGPLTHCFLAALIWCLAAKVLTGDDLRLPALCKHCPSAAYWQVCHLVLAPHLQAEQVGAWEQLPDPIKLEVGSPHAFLCEDAMVLHRPISMRGYPKLWLLPPQILSRARDALYRPPQVIRFHMHAASFLCFPCKTT